MKVMKKILTVMLTLVLAVVTMLGMTSTSTVSANTTEETHRAAIKIAKYLQGSNGLLPETDSFSWKITPISYQQASISQSEIEAKDMPVIANGNVLSVTTKGTTTAVTDSSTGVTTATISGANPVVGNTHRDYEGTVYFDFAEDQPIGVYTYHIQEIKPATSDGIVYDTDGYYINIYVVNIVDNNGVILTPHKTTIANITAWKNDNTKNNDGNKSDVASSDDETENNNLSGNDEPGKNIVNSETPTHEGTDVGTGKTAITTQVSIVAGENAIELTSPYENGFQTYKLTVGTHVVGNYASVEDVFTYNVTINDSALSSATKLKVTYTGLSTRAVTEIGLGTSTAITLKHGQTFTIEGLSSLATYTVTEENPNNYYTPAALYTAGHLLLAPGSFQENTILGSDNPLFFTEVINISNPATAYNVPILNRDRIDTTKQNTALSVSGTIETNYGVSEGAIAGTWAKPQGIHEDVKIMYTNLKDYVTPTGMLMNVLPYAIGVIGVAAIVVVVVMKKHKDGNKGSNNGL